MPRSVRSALGTVFPGLVLLGMPRAGDPGPWHLAQDRSPTGWRVLQPGGDPVEKVTGPLQCALPRYFELEFEWRGTGRLEASAAGLRASEDVAAFPLEASAEVVSPFAEGEGWHRARLVASPRNPAPGAHELRFAASAGMQPVRRVLHSAEPGPVTVLLVPQAGLALRAARMRDLDELFRDRISLLPDATLEGWHSLGDARYRVEGDAILGETGGGSQSFLMTDREFGDFRLDVDVRTELPGNSGIQIRSHRDAAGRVSGYQVEIDPSARAWSGGIYDEARRGWLQDLEDNPAGRTAFQPGEWNHYCIECRGTRIQAWVNGIPTADLIDPVDLTGHLGLQVHAGQDTRVRWRDPELVDLGTSCWKELLHASPAALVVESGSLDAASGCLRPDPDIGACLRLERASRDGSLRVRYRGVGPLRLRARATRPGSPGAPGASAVTVVAGELCVDTAALFPPDPPVSPEPSHEVVLSAQGSHLAVHGDGKLLWDRPRGAPEGGALWLLELGPEAHAVVLESVEEIEP